MLADRLACLNAGYAGHHHIHDDEVYGIIHDLYGAGSAVCLHDFTALAFQEYTDDLTDFRVIVH